MLLINIVSLFLCFRPKYGLPFTFAVFTVYGLAVHFLYNPLVIQTPFAPFGGIILLPAMVLLFRGQTFQKVFAFFMCGQLSSMQVSIADALISSIIGADSAIAQTAFAALALFLLGVYLVLVLRFGKRLFQRLFVDGRRSIWVLYSFGSAFSFFIAALLRWQDVGALLYMAMLLFILWSFGVLCYTIINMHEKATQAHQSETLQLQMDALREQIDEEKKHWGDMEALRHEMRQEMGVIMELFRTNKASEAEAVYADWQNTLQDATNVKLCAEPMLNAVLTRFARRARDKNIHLHIDSKIPEECPIDTIKLSVMVANALENAINATDEIKQTNKRIIRVKLIWENDQIGLEVINPCAAPVEFDGKGLPISNKRGHGVGVRSIAAFAHDNGSLLDFNYSRGMFTMRLLTDASE